MTNAIAIPKSGRFQDLTGQRFSEWTVISYAGLRLGVSSWNCLCCCGLAAIRTSKQLKNTRHPCRSCSNRLRRADFWSQVDKSGECWEWNGIIKSSGYAEFCYQGKKTSCHRFSYETEVGPIPDGMFVCHKCDNKKCVRPDHLFAGTPKDNSQDMVSKGRGTRGQQRPGTGSAGERNTKAKLTASDVLAIRQEYKSRRLLIKQIAARFGITVGQVHKIARRALWNHVQEAPTNA